MKVGVVRFPGSHGTDDVLYAYSRVLGIEAIEIWHEQESLPNITLLVLPGGASFMDALRPGALARTSPISASIRRFARTGRVLGIGNGFQILCELGVLNGVLLRNKEVRFVGESVRLRQEETPCQLIPSAPTDPADYPQLPLACDYGRYHVDTRTLTEMEEKGLVVYRYCDEFGEALVDEVPTGSVKAIAGVTNHAGNVLGVMFHPERMVEEIQGGTQGRALLLAAVGAVDPEG